MSEIGLIESVLPLGVGGVLAIVILIFYREARNDQEERRVQWEQERTKLTEQYKADAEQRNGRYEKLAESLITLVESQVRQNAALEQTIKQQGQLRELELMESRLRQQYGKE